MARQETGLVAFAAHADLRSTDNGTMVRLGVFIGNGLKADPTAHDE
jgi:arginase family enzyme